MIGFHDIFATNADRNTRPPTINYENPGEEFQVKVLFLSKNKPEKVYFVRATLISFLFFYLFFYPLF